MDRKHIAAIYVRVFCLCFPLGVSVSSLTFRSLIHFELIFVTVVKEWSNFIFFLHVAVQFSQHHYWRDCLNNIVWSCLFCHRFIDHGCMDLFLGFLSSSINLYVYFCASTILFGRGGHGNPLQYSCLENPHGQRQRSLASYIIVQRVTKSQTWLSDWHTHHTVLMTSFVG